MYFGFSSKPRYQGNGSLDFIISIKFCGERLVIALAAKYVTSMTCNLLLPVNIAEDMQSFSSHSIIFLFFRIYKKDTWYGWTWARLDPMQFVPRFSIFFIRKSRYLAIIIFLYGNRGSNNKVWFTTVPLVPRLVPLYLDFRRPKTNVAISRKKGP